jgi:hypothetical protein
MTYFYYVVSVDYTLYQGALLPSLAFFCFTREPQRQQAAAALNDNNDNDNDDDREETTMRIAMQGNDWWSQW